MNERDAWIGIRAALLAIVDVIERWWKLGKHAEK
jgi:hypothetical protein